LFTETWGVDVSVSTPQLLTSLVEEAVSVGDLVRLLDLEQGRVSLVEVRLAEGSPAVGKTVGQLKMPPDCTLVAIVRDRHVIAPTPDTPLHTDDEVLALASSEAEQDLKTALTGD
jgi:trk system potassium uptake protein TrkA